MQALEAIPTKLFRVTGFKGTFSVDKKPVEFVGGKTGFQAIWSTSGADYGFESASGMTREEAFGNLMDRICNNKQLLKKASK